MNVVHNSNRIMKKMHKDLSVGTETIFDKT